MDTLYLHIGRGKTGTTSLQAFLADNRKELARRGFRYPPSGRRNAHHLLVPAFGDDRHYWIHPKRPAAAERRAFVRELRRWKGHVIVSSEAFGRADPEHIEALARAVEGLRSVKVVYYARRQDRAFESSFNQSVKSQHPLGELDEVFAHHLDQFNLDYHRTAEKWAAVFGRDNVIIRVYEKTQMPNGIIADFLGVLGIGDTTGFRFPEERSNPSLTPLGLRIYGLVAGHELPRVHGFGKVLEKVLGPDNPLVTNAGAPLLLSAEQRARLLATYEESNATLARDYLGRVDGRLFEDPPPGPEVQVPPVPDLSAKTAMAIAAEAWSAQDRKYRRRKRWAIWAIVGLFLLSGALAAALVASLLF